MKKKYLIYDLQLFAEDNKGTGSDNPDQAGEGENTDTTGAKEGDETNGGADDSSKAGKTFSQKQVSAMMTKEKKQGRNAAYAELGIDPNNVQQVAMVKALIESQKTDEQKLNEEAAAQAAKIAEAEHRAAVAEAKAEAMKAGAKSEFVDDIVALAMTKVDENTDIESAIGELKTKYQVWFGQDEPDGRSAGQRGTGTSVGNGTGNSSSSKDGGQSLGSRLAANRQAVRAGGKERKSFWS